MPAQEDIIIEEDKDIFSIHLYVVNELEPNREEYPLIQHDFSEDQKIQADLLPGVTEEYVVNLGGSLSKTFNDNNCKETKKLRNKHSVCLIMKV